MKINREDILNERNRKSFAQFVFITAIAQIGIENLPEIADQKEFDIEFKINGKEVDFAKIINRFQEHFEEEMEKISKHSEREMISMFEERYAEVTKLVVEKLIKSKPYQSFEQEEV